MAVALMLYALYHAVTDTHMDDNGLPGWVDMLGGIVDVLLLVGVAWAMTSLTGHL